MGTIGNYRKRYELEGASGLLKNNYFGSEVMLSCAEIKELTAHLEIQTYLTVEAIVDYVKQIYNVHYSISGMRQLLHRLQFVYKKAKTILYNKYYEKFAEFRVEVMRFFENIALYNDKLSSLLTKNFQIIGM